MTKSASVIKPAKSGIPDWLRNTILIVALAALVILPIAMFMRWEWLPTYAQRLIDGLGRTVFLLLFSCILGLLLAIPLALAQITGPRPLAWLANGFCTLIRGTPLLVQLWLLYYGLGSLFPLIPWIRESWAWPILREAWPYALLSFTLSYAGYEGEILRGAMLGIPKGELEAARATGMTPFQVLRRVWLPRALLQALPTLSGETVSQLKSTPLAATITIFDVYGVARRVQQDTFIIYEPLLLIALIYCILTGIIVLFFRWLESRVPIKRG
jgi:polar amino acid transport system permease protein